MTDHKIAEQKAQNRDLELQIAAEVANDTSGTPDTSHLLVKAVNLICERLGFYHASIYLIDSSGEYAVLRESRGEAGTLLKQNGHRLAVGSQSVVGQASFRKQPLIINNVADHPLYHANPLLPETRSELALPLIASEKLIGAIDVQSKTENTFRGEDVSLFQILADLLATAIWNSVLSEQSQSILERYRLLQHITIAASTAKTVEDSFRITLEMLLSASFGNRALILSSDDDDVLRVSMAAGYDLTETANLSLLRGEGIPGKVIATGQPVRMNDLRHQPDSLSLDRSAGSELAVPVVFADRIIGVLDITHASPGQYDETDQEILASLGNTLGAIITNSQLMQEVRLQVERQRKLYEITNQIRRSADIQAIMQTSTREIARLLGARRAMMKIGIEQIEQSDMSAEIPGNGRHPDQEQSQ